MLSAIIVKGGRTWKVEKGEANEEGTQQIGGDMCKWSHKVWIMICNKTMTTGFKVSCAQLVFMAIPIEGTAVAAITH